MSDNNDVSVSEIGSNLFDCADILRGYVDKGEYKDYILPLVFYAEVNRRFLNAYEEELEEMGYDDESDVSDDLDEAIRGIASQDIAQDIHIPAGHTWNSLSESSENVAVDIDDALTQFEEKNERYTGAFEDEYSNVSSFRDNSGHEALEVLDSDALLDTDELAAYITAWKSMINEKRREP